MTPAATCLCLLRHPWYVVISHCPCSQFVDHPFCGFLDNLYCIIPIFLMRHLWYIYNSYCPCSHFLTTTVWDRQFSSIMQSYCYHALHQLAVSCFHSRLLSLPNLLCWLGCMTCLQLDIPALLPPQPLHLTPYPVLTSVP